MTDLESHKQICIALKRERLLSNQMIRVIWHIATEHGVTNPNLSREGYTTMEDFIKAISQRPTTTNIVEPLKKE